MLSGCEVLVVDDRDDTRAVIVKILADHGATVATAASAEGALVALSRASPPPHVVVTDFSLMGARRDAAWLLHRIRATWGTAVGVVVATGFSHLEPELSRLGFDGFLFKPLDPMELVAIVARVYEGRRANPP